MKYPMKYIPWNILWNISHEIYPMKYSIIYPIMIGMGWDVDIYIYIVYISLKNISTSHPSHPKIISWIPSGRRSFVAAWSITVARLRRSFSSTARDSWDRTWRLKNEIFMGFLVVFLWKMVVEWDLIYDIANIASGYDVYSLRTGKWPSRNSGFTQLQNGDVQQLCKRLPEGMPCERAMVRREGKNEAGFMSFWWGKNEGSAYLKSCGNEGHISIFPFRWRTNKPQKARVTAGFARKYFIPMV